MIFDKKKFLVVIYKFDITADETIRMKVVYKLKHLGKLVSTSNVLGPLRFWQFNFEINYVHHLIT